MSKLHYHTSIDTKAEGEAESRRPRHEDNPVLPSLMRVTVASTQLHHEVLK